MRTLVGLSLIPLICLGVMFLTAVVIFVALRRGTRNIADQLEKAEGIQQNKKPADTRWARSDLRSPPTIIDVEEKTILCPACGGENSAANNSCVFCGRKL